MSVASKNPFALLNDDESSPPSSPKAKPVPTPAPPAPVKEQKPGKTGPASKGGKYYNRGGAVRNAAPRDSQPTATDGEAPPERKYDGERRGRGRGRGGRGGRGREDGGRGRVYDRHSATGIVDSDKKIHQGWGGDDGATELKQEIAAEADAAATANEWNTPAAGDSWGANDGVQATDDSNTTPATAAEGGTKERRREREEEDDSKITYEEYIVQQKAKLENVVPKIEALRHANEGADDKGWKGVTPLKKGSENDDAYFIGKTKAATKPRAKKEEKITLEFEGHFERPGGRGRGRGGDRGDRRGGRGGRGRGGRSDRNGAVAVNVDDTTAFPTLS